MNFRLLLADRALEVTTLHQSAAILSLEEDEKIGVETETFIYHLQFNKQGQVYVLSQFESISKDD